MWREQNGTIIVGFVLIIVVLSEAFRTLWSGFRVTPHVNSLLKFSFWLLKTNFEYKNRIGFGQELKFQLILGVLYLSKTGLFQLFLKFQENDSFICQGRIISQSSELQDKILTEERRQSNHSTWEAESNRALSSRLGLQRGFQPSQSIWWDPVTNQPTTIHTTTRRDRKLAWQRRA